MGDLTARVAAMIEARVAWAVAAPEDCGPLAADIVREVLAAPGALADDDERRETRLIARAERATIRFPHSDVFELVYNHAQEVYRGPRRGALWRTLLDRALTVLAREDEGNLRR